MARKSRKNLPQPEQAAASVLLPELEEAKMPAAIYGRLSVEDEETEECMETQIALVQDYINRSRELSYVDLLDYEGVSFRRNVIVIGRWCPNQTLSGYAEKWSKVHTEFRQSKT